MQGKNKQPMSRRQSIHSHITIGLTDPDSGIVNAVRSVGGGGMAEKGGWHGHLTI